MLLIVESVSIKVVMQIEKKVQESRTYGKRDAMKTYAGTIPFIASLQEHHLLPSLYSFLS
jgi:hypothetical protein